MAEAKQKRLSKVARELNVGLSTIMDFLQESELDMGGKLTPNTKIAPEAYQLLLEEFGSDIKIKQESDNVHLPKSRDKKSLSLEDVQPEKEQDEEDDGNEVLITDVSSEAITGPKEKKEEIKEKKEEIVEEEKKEKKGEEKGEEIQINVKGKIDLKSINQKTRPDKKTKEEKEAERKERAEKEKKAKETKEEIKQKEKEKGKEKPPVKEQKKEKKEAEEHETEYKKLSGPTVVGKIDLPKEKEPSKDKDEAERKKKKKRKRIRKERVNLSDKGKDRSKEKGKGKKGKRAGKPDISEEEIQQQVKDTLAKLTSKEKSKAAKFRRQKRDAASEKIQKEEERRQEEKSTLKVTEFVSVNEMSNLMDVPVNNIISACMNLGLFVSINQRLDAETMSLVAGEFGFEVEFVSVDAQENVEVEEEDESQLVARPPIVTVMGHVDHGKTSLLDYIRKTNVIAGESGGITQHIGAYNVELEDGREITFLDTPGHEAFTAMRARGAQVTDLAIIVVAADDSVMPQTVEAINHAAAAGVPMVFAINKMDRPTANAEKIKEELANMNYLVEDWGGKYQSQEISAKNGQNIPELLEKVLLEAELLDLKANPNKLASGVIIEATLDRGRGHVATMLVQNGTLKQGDLILAGHHFGNVKAMFNERNQKTETAGPSSPALILGLNGAPQAGDRFNVMENEREAREIANKREQLQREQGLRAQKHITLDEIGRRLAIGDFQELNIIVKGDVDGSVEALADSLQKLSTEKIQVNIRHKAVGQISESDVMLASASDAVIVGFQVRPSLSARKLAEKEQIDIRLYSIIYDAINEIRDALEGMLSPEIKEEITGTAEIREIFKITKVGTVAGCMVKDGKISRKNRVRVIRDGIVIYTGNLGSLKRFKDDAKEVQSGYECGLNIENFNDIKVGDIVEAFQETEVKQKL